jgi:TolB-like protein/Flp pilus assembly protein TadD
MEAFGFKAFITEARRRRVFRVVALYIVGAWIALQASALAFPGLDIPDFAIRYVWIGAALVLPVALFFGWRYDISDGRIVRTADSDTESALPAGRADYFILTAMSILVVVILIQLAGAISGSRVTSIRRVAVTDVDPNSIAVLPFVNMSSDQEQEYFSDGLSEELLNLLAKIPRLKVISRSSSFSFKGKGLDTRTIANQLDVALVLEGSVRKSGDKIRVTAQLIEAPTDTHLWSDTYDRNLADVFAIQDEIAAAIVSALGDQLAIEVSEVAKARITDSVEAHEAFLRGRYMAAKRTPKSVAEAIREFENAIDLDPEFALAHGELAITNMLGYASRPDAESVSKLTPHIFKAMAHEPALPEARAAAGHYSWFQGNLEEALDYFQQASKINPNYSDVYVWMALILEYELGRYAEAFEARKKARILDPLSIIALSNYIYALMDRNRLEEADRELAKLEVLSPLAHSELLAFRNGLGGDWANFAFGALDMLLINPEDTRMLGRLQNSLALLGLEAEARAIQEPIQPVKLSLLGDPAGAVEVVDKMLESDPNSHALREFLGLVLAGAGDYARARPILEDLWAQHRDQTMSGLGAYFPAALLAIRSNAGEEVHLDELLLAIRQEAQQMEEAGITLVTWNMSKDFDLGLAHFMSGETEQGLELITRAVEQGYFVPSNEVYMQSLYDDPGFAAIENIQRFRRNRERDMFLTVVCADNKYEKVWKPESATCEQFAESE